MLEHLPQVHAVREVAQRRFLPPRERGQETPVYKPPEEAQEKEGQVLRTHSPAADIPGEALRSGERCSCLVVPILVARVVLRCKAAPAWGAQAFHRLLLGDPEGVAVAAHASQVARSFALAAGSQVEGVRTPVAGDSPEEVHRFAARIQEERLPGPSVVAPLTGVQSQTWLVS
jgi:hypothetical protein